MTVGRYFRTPKGTLLLVLCLEIAAAATRERAASVIAGVGSAVLSSALLDALILRKRKRRWVLPDGAVLTALIVGMILSPHEPWWVVAITALVAVSSKYILRAGKANLFNPAALGLVATFYVFNTAQSWWGAMPEMPAAWIALLLAGGVFTAQRVKKIPAMLAFLGSYYALFAIAAFAGSPSRVAEVYRTPDVQAALFFAFFMVTDPPTSPPRPRDQTVFGVICGAASFAFFETIGAAYFLPAGVLVANLWDGWRRYSGTHITANITTRQTA